MGKKFNYIFIGLCCVIMLVYVFGFTDWAGFAEMVNSVSPFWLVASVLCILNPAPLYQQAVPRPAAKAFHPRFHDWAVF